MKQAMHLSVCSVAKGIATLLKCEYQYPMCAGLPGAWPNGFQIRTDKNNPRVGFRTTQDGSTVRMSAFKLYSKDRYPCTEKERYGMFDRRDFLHNAFA